MEAISSSRVDGDKSGLARLWQLPLLAVSLALFGVAAWLFIKPNFGATPPTIDQLYDRAQAAMKDDRPELAIELFQKMRETGKVAGELDARVHLLQAEAIEQLQKLRKQSLAVNHGQIIEHTKAALAGGIKPDTAIHKRLAESYDALGRGTDALDQYRKAIAADPQKTPALLRKIIDLQLVKGDTANAMLSLDDYLKETKLTEAERIWGVGEKSRLLVDEKRFAEAVTLLDKVDLSHASPLTRGQINYRHGYSHWKQGDFTKAAPQLRAARNDLKNDPLDADAAYLLGKISQAANNPAEAASFFQSVIVDHPDASVAPASRLERGVCRVLAGDDEAGLNDLTDMSREIASRPARAKLKPEALVALKTSSEALAKRGKPLAVLEIAELELLLQPEQPAAFFERIGAACEKRASQVEQAITSASSEADRAQKLREVRLMRSKAGDAAVARANKLTVDSDAESAAALWKAIDLYDQAGDLDRSIQTLAKFVDERPDDGKAPDALLRMGQALQVAGRFDEAIAAFQKTQFRYPQSLAASKSGVPLAQAYVAKGPATYAKAEAALQSTLESQLLTPEADDFKDALIEMAQLYYRQGRFEEAVSRLEEIKTRYPSDSRTGHVMFLIADSYRKSAALLKQGTGISAAATRPSTPAAALASNAQGSADGKAEVATAAAANSAAARAEIEAARRQRLAKARQLFDQLIDYYQANPPANDLDRLHQRLSHFYRADTAFDSGAFDEAIRLYDAAALRYQDDPSALAAYVQIVNAYAALNKPEEAKAANERARWLLKRIPPEAFKEGAIPMPREYWDNWLKWSSEAGLW